MNINLTEKDLDKKIYRIISLDRLLELFSSKQNVLVKPELWEDTFENFILKSNIRQSDGTVTQFEFHKKIFGQCWTLHKSSDAMWRIYSPQKDGVRIRTTIRQLIQGLYNTLNVAMPDAYGCIGRVKYLSESQLMDLAHSTFMDDGIYLGSMFNSLLVKRKAFRHEKEIRVLYEDHTNSYYLNNNIFKYYFNPHEMVSQLMIDPRISYTEFKSIKNQIIEATGYKGEIKRSLLYRLPKDIILDVKSKQS